MRVLSRVIRPTVEELRASPLVDPDFLARREWSESNIRPTVVFEIVSPNDTTADVRTKQLLYKSLGIHLAVVLDSDAKTIYADELTDDVLTESIDYSGRLIPGLDISLAYDDNTQLIVRNATGERCPTPAETRRLATDATNRISQARAEVAKARADADQAQADAAKAKTNAEAEVAKAKADAAKALADVTRLRDRLRSAGLDTNGSETNPNR